MIRHKRRSQVTALSLGNVTGLLGVFAVGYPGYFVFDVIWTGYYSSITAGKNVWLLGQALFIAIFFVGSLMMFDTVRRAPNSIPRSQGN